MNVLKCGPECGDVVGYIFHIIGRAIIIAVIFLSDPCIKMYLGLGAGKELSQRIITYPIRHIRESGLVTATCATSGGRCRSNLK
jgi:hypothetical protein